MLQLILSKIFAIYLMLSSFCSYGDDITWQSKVRSYFDSMTSGEIKFHYENQPESDHSVIKWKKPNKIIITQDDVCISIIDKKIRVYDKVTEEYIHSSDNFVPDDISDFENSLINIWLKNTTFDMVEASISENNPEILSVKIKNNIYIDFLIQNNKIISIKKLYNSDTTIYISEISIKNIDDQDFILDY